jgi:hypothetical protein
LILNFIDFDITSSYDEKNKVLYIPKYLCFDGEKREKVDSVDIDSYFNYFYNKKCSTFEDIEYILPTIEKDSDVDLINQLTYLLSSDEDCSFYDKIWEIIHSKNINKNTKWKKITSLLNCKSL